MIENLSHSETSSETLGRQLDASSATVKRYLVEARELGADIRSVRMNGGWVYELRNWPAIMNRVRIWIQLEEERDLTEF